MKTQTFDDFPWRMELAHLAGPMLEKKFCPPLQDAGGCDALSLCQDFKALKVTVLALDAAKLKKLSSDAL